MKFLLVATASLALIAGVPAVSARDTGSPHLVAEAVRAQSDAELRAFYEQRGFAPVWVEGDGLSWAGERFLDHLSRAELDGLDPDSYDFETLRARAVAAGADEERAARAEIAFTREFVRFVRDMRRPSTDMIYADEELARQPDADAILAEVANARSFDRYVENMEWMSPYYTQLRAALEQVDPGASTTAAIRIPEGPILRLGDSGERVRLLRARLDLDDGDAYDLDVAEAVGRFQESSGLRPDNAAGARTIAALNGPSADHLGLLRSNLERARALPGPWTRHVVVNAAAAQLSYFDQGTEQGTMKVVVGTPQTPTPIMAGKIQFATLNPYWNVPVSLAKKNIAPAVLAGNSLRAMRYEALSGWTEDAALIEASSIDWHAVVEGREDVRLRKLPGSDNAMGSVKFIFPNDLGIYLHDTPDRQLFNERARQFSNGCVRLEDAARLGDWLFDEPLQAESNSPEQHVRLPDPVPVYITYLTAIPAGGTIAFTADVYGLDGFDNSEMLASR